MAHVWGVRHGHTRDCGRDEHNVQPTGHQIPVLTMISPACPALALMLVITQDIHSRLALFTVVIGLLTEATGRVVENSADCLANCAHRRRRG